VSLFYAAVKTEVFFRIHIHGKVEHQTMRHNILCKKKGTGQFTDSIPLFLLVAGGGFEPPTFGL